MFRTVVIALVLAVAAPSAAIAADLQANPPDLRADQAAPQETASSCKTPGTMTFAALPDVRTEIYPSVRSQLASAGRMAKTNGCTVEVTCVSAEDADKEARAFRNGQCRAAAQSIVRYEQRSAIRSRLIDEVVRTLATANGDLVAGTVYVTLR